jgi:pantoate--beta-alanine ligase
MEVIEQAASMQAIVSALRCAGKRIGFVPTMGALHEGHLQLLRASARENDVTICSVFVNPTQFNNASDYKLYPRTLEQDISLLQTVDCDYLFAPLAEELYAQQTLLQFSFGELEAVMEGAHRPGHFNGVATIVSKLFHIVQPHKAYFGQKDLQQVAVVRQLVHTLGFNLELVRHPTVREADGLAMSSRNKRLTATQRQLATQLYKALQLAKRSISQKSVIAIKSEVAHFLQKVDELELEYFEVVNPDTLQPLADVAGREEVALCIAAFVGEVRLIDNILVNLKEI